MDEPGVAKSKLCDRCAAHDWLIKIDNELICGYCAQTEIVKLRSSVAALSAANDPTSQTPEETAFWEKVERSLESK